jgi:15-cis-phytoene synthase
VSVTLDAAYGTCDTITRVEARNFHYGIRLLPPAKRRALCAVYALARRIDDIGDGDLPLAEKHQALADLRCSLVVPADSSDPVLLAVADVAHRFVLPMSAFDELIDGVELDLAATRYATFDDLVGYCRCVAGSVGRLCLAIFGSRDPAAASGYADALGVALQQTNILRDLREDLIAGRVYLPQQDLDRFGVRLRLDPGTGALVDEGGALSALVRAAAARNVQWYDEGLRLLPLLDRRSAACTAAMAGIYRRLLTRIAADPALVFAGRLSLSGREKLTVAGRALVHQ